MTTHTPLSLDDISGILAMCAARDQRTVGRADVLAWWQDLNEAKITKADAEAAISRYYAVDWPRQAPADRFRITAPVVIESVLKARKARTDGFVYDNRPHLGETGREYTHNLREQLAQVGSDTRPPVPHDAVGPDPHAANRILALVAAGAQSTTLPPDVAQVIAKRRHPAFAVPCPSPSCHAPAGERCKLAKGSKGSKIAGGVHPSRVDNWATIAAACPACRAPALTACHEAGRPYAQGAHRERIAAAQKETA